MAPTPPDLLRAFLAGRDEPCAKCGYNLRDTIAEVCPECGTPLRLTLDRPVMPRIAVRLAVVVLVGNLAIRASYAALVLLPLLEGRGTPNRLLGWQLNLIAHAVVSTGWTLAWLVVAVRRHRHGPPGAAGRSLLLAGFWLFAFDSLLWPLISFLFERFGP